MPSIPGKNILKDVYTAVSLLMHTHCLESCLQQDKVYIVEKISRIPPPKKNRNSPHSPATDELGELETLAI